MFIIVITIHTINNKDQSDSICRPESSGRPG